MRADNILISVSILRFLEMRFEGILIYLNYFDDFDNFATWFEKFVEHKSTCERISEREKTVSARDWTGVISGELVWISFEFVN
jgi:hypothetical protein